MRLSAHTKRPGWILFLRVAAFTTLAFAAIVYAGSVMKVARKGNEFGGPWASYLAQKPDTVDVMFFGTSHAFTAIDPSEIWRRHGIASFVLAGPVQRMQITKYYFRESLKTQSPKVVAIEIVSMSYEEGAYDKLFHPVNVGYMPLSKNRVAAALLETPWGEKTGVILDIWSNHTRWSDVQAADFDVVGKQAGYEYLRGFIPLVGVHKSISPTPSPNATKPLPGKPSDAVAFNLGALREIAEECKKRDIALLLYAAPTGPPGDNNLLLRETARELQKEYPDVRMLDLSLPGAVPGLSVETDFYDDEHLNHLGAEKLGGYLGGWLRDAYNLPDRRNDARYGGWDADAGQRDAYVRKLERERAKKVKR